jgi:hypothetical protein
MPEPMKPVEDVVHAAFEGAVVAVAAVAVGL